MSNLILLETRDGIATLTLNRPERHNSLVPELLCEMLNALDGLSHQVELCAIVLQANGRSFSTGGDVQAFYDHRDNIGVYASEIVGLLNQVIVAMVRLPAPIVAAVHGIVHRRLARICAGVGYRVRRARSQFRAILFRRRL